MTLARAIRARGAGVSISFLRGGPTPHDRSSLASEGITLIDAPRANRHDVVVVDLPDPNEVTSSLSAGERLVVLDDREAFKGRAAIVVQPSLGWWAGPGRADRVLAGYEWAPIGPAWRQVVDDAGIDHSGPPRVLVCFGGSDPGAVTARLGPTLAADPRWSTTVVVGHDYAGLRPSSVDLVQDPTDLPARVAGADVVVVGAGTMKFEVAAIGRPALLLAVADDQLPVGPPFAATGAARWLGDGRTIDPEAVRRAVAALLDDGPAREAMATTARRVVDGNGADRLAAEIVALVPPMARL